MPLRERVRERVLPATVALTAVSLALVFGAVGGAIPAEILPRVSGDLLAAIPAVNAALSTAAIATIALGWLSIRRGSVARHRSLMLLSTALFGTFLVLYLYRIVLRGTTAFGGPDAVYRFVYLPVLAIHVLLAIAAIPPVYYALLLAGTRPASEIPTTNHARVGRVAATLWLITFALGDVVYLLLYVLY